VVTANEENLLGVDDLESKEQTNNLQGVPSSIDEIAWSSKRQHNATTISQAKRFVPKKR
jgi:hypothetical protein